jgi:Protein of Unknown function (DUF2784)
MYEALSYGTALTHLAFVVLLVGGAFVVHRRPSFAWFHLPLVVAMAVVSFAGADCPLTTLESYFRERAGWQPHGNGFVSTYLVEPWHPEGITPGIRVLIILIWIVPNVVACGHVLLSRRRQRRGMSGMAGVVGRDEGSLA